MSKIVNNPELEQKKSVFQKPRQNRKLKLRKKKKKKILNPKKMKKVRIKKVTTKRVQIQKAPMNKKFLKTITTHSFLIFASILSIFPFLWLIKFSFCITSVAIIFIDLPTVFIKLATFGFFWKSLTFAIIWSHRLKLLAFIYFNVL